MEFLEAAGYRKRLKVRKLREHDYERLVRDNPTRRQRYARLTLLSFAEIFAQLPELRRGAHRKEAAGREVVRRRDDDKMSWTAIAKKRYPNHSPDDRPRLKARLQQQYRRYKRNPEQN
jgi:hypothetical protein